MSLYIAGLNLPHKDANPITLMIFHDGSIWHYDDETEFKAIQVPPHGRLGDLDDLEERIKICQETAQNDDFDLGVIWYSAFAEMAALSQTIIPADGAGKEDDSPVCTKASPASLGIYTKEAEK